MVRAGAWLICTLTVGVGLSCDAINPSFLNVVAPNGGQNLETVSNPPGHVVIQFVNNAEVSERLIDFMTSEEGGGLMLTDAQRRALRPRIRMRVQVTFTDGSFNVIEFIDGSSELVSPEFDATTTPDLNQNSLDNVVLLCDVRLVEILPESDIEVFVPVPLSQFELVETRDDAGVIVAITPVLREVIPPQFQVLQVDDLDGDGNVLVQRNIGVRDVPSPVPTPLCGSVVTIELRGELSVPFLTAPQRLDIPSFDQDDPSAEGSIGGRYEFIVGVR